MQYVILSEVHDTMMMILFSLQYDDDPFQFVANFEED